MEVIMRTTVDVDVDELDEIMRLTKASSRSAVITAGLKALRERLTLTALADMIERGPAHPAEAAPRRKR
jgi:hypothetical protein